MPRTPRRTRFTSADVVRHPLVQKIIDAYERDTGSGNGGGR
jgi:phosphate starvation-inducible protein PhoH